MFLNNPASARSILANNENATTAHRSKSIGENGTKKATFNENSAKTPHRNKDAASSKGGQNTQRRRRALGDISNRKGGGGGSGAKGGVILKQATGSLKSTNSKNLFPSSSTKNRTAQVKFSKTPSAKNASSKARLGGGVGLNSSNPKLKQRAPASEYDGVFGATTRWAREDVADDSRPPFDLIPKDELDLFSDCRDEIQNHQKKECDERDRLELERCEEKFLEQVNDIDIDGLGNKLGGSCDISGDDPTDEWDLLHQKLPWEEEDGVYDPAEERRLSGSDPYSLWGDI